MSYKYYYGWTISFGNFVSEFHATLPSDELELSFKEAIENLPRGKLQNSLNNNFSKHFKKLKKYDLHLHTDVYYRQMAAFLIS